MVALIAFIILAALAGGLAKLYATFRVQIHFYLTGLDEKFSLPEIAMLWNVSQLCNLDEPISLFVSMPSLTRCISQIKSQAEVAAAENSAKMQNLLSKLYTFRTKIEKDADKKRGLESTRALDVGQKLRIVLPGKGVFFSEIVNTGRELTIRLPTQKDIITVEGKDWLQKTISVYLWRTGDARYVFDTAVLGQGLFLGKPALYLQHSSNLLRTQKRNAVRAKCHILANLYILKDKDIDYNVIETKPGYKCLLEDISESGALIRIGGKGVPNLQLRLQYQLQNRLVVMFGIVRTVEYNQEAQQSRLHFECIHIDPAMKNQVLSYVYNILPQNEKDIYDAISYTTMDEKEDEAQSEAADEAELPNGTETAADAGTAAEAGFENPLPPLPEADGTRAAQDAGNVAQAETEEERHEGI